MCFLLTTRTGAVNTAFDILQVSRNAKWIFTETQAFGKSPFPPRIFQVFPKESSFLAAQSFGLLHVWALSVQMSFIQMKWKAVSLCRIWLWAPRVSRSHGQLVCESAWWQHATFQLRGSASMVLHGLLFGSGLVLRFTYLVLCFCIVLEKWYLHIKCFSCAVWLQKALGAMGSDLKWVWIKPALHCCECRKEELNLRRISPPYVTPTRPPSIWPLSTGSLPWVLVVSL